MASSHNNSPKATSEKSEHNAKVKKIQRYLEPVVQAKNIKYTKTARLENCERELKVGILTNSTDAILLYGYTGMGNSAAINFVTDDILNSSGTSVMNDITILRFSFKEFREVPSTETLAEAIEKTLEKLVKKDVKKVLIIAENIEFWNFDQIEAFMHGFRAVRHEQKHVFEMMKLLVSYSVKEKDLKVEKGKCAVVEFFKSLSENDGFKIIHNHDFEKEKNMAEILKPRIKELEELYQIHLDTNIAEYISVVEFPKSYTDYMKSVEELLVYTEGKNEKIATLEILKARCFEVDYSNRLQTKETRKFYAYHEAGHMLMTLNFPEYFEPKAIATFTKFAAGVSSSRWIMFGPGYKDFVMANIIVILGGRVAEEELLNVNTLAARTDLKQAQRVVSDYISCSGDNEVWAHNYSIINAERVSEKTWYELEKAEKDLLKKLTKKAKKILKKHEKFVHILAEKLILKEMLTGKEVDELWRNYLQEKDVKKSTKVAKKKD